MANELGIIEQMLLKLIPSPLLHFEVQIADHCNLNCNQCTHFSPIAEEKFIDVNSYKKDCTRLSELFDGEMSFISLMGGEPLLHPQITEVMRVTREAFPIGKIRIVTNGLLLPSMPEDFWEACKMYDVEISATAYPVNFNYDSLNKIADSKNAKITFYHMYTSRHNVQLRMPVAPGGSADPTSNYLYCGHTSCTTLKNGKMYVCPTAAHAPHLKKYFNLDMHLSEKNGVDIYSVKDGDELLKKLARPIPFCQYCDVVAYALLRCDWGISKKDRYEWLAFGFTEDDVRYLKSKKPVVYVFGAGALGHRAVASLQDEGIAVKSVLATRKKAGIDNILGVPIVILNELGEVEPDSVCLVALTHHSQKMEVYPLLSQVGFGDVIPVY